MIKQAILGLVLILSLCTETFAATRDDALCAKASAQTNAANYVLYFDYNYTPDSNIALAALNSVQPARSWWTSMQKMAYAAIIGNANMDFSDAISCLNEATTLVNAANAHFTAGTTAFNNQDYETAFSAWMSASMEYMSGKMKLETADGYYLDAAVGYGNANAFYTNNP